MAEVVEFQEQFQITKAQRAFLEWLVVPEDYRQPATYRAYSEAHSVSEATLRRWRQDKNFREAWDARLTELNLEPERVQRIIDAMQKKAEAGDVKAAQLLLEYLGKFQPIQRVQIERPADMTDEQLAAALAQASEQLTAQKLRAV